MSPSIVFSRPSRTIAFGSRAIASCSAIESWLPRTNTYGRPNPGISVAIRFSTGVPNDVMSPVSITKSTSNPLATSCAKSIPSGDAWMSEMCSTRIASSAGGVACSDV